jgi:hypothetical protein
MGSGFSFYLDRFVDQFGQVMKRHLATDTPGAFGKVKITKRTGRDNFVGPGFHPFLDPEAGVLACPVRESGHHTTAAAATV